MKTLYVTLGLPGSGKTTWCRNKMAEVGHGNIKRVSKDSLREMLDGGSWSGKNEDFILKARDSLLCAALRAGFHAIADDTNLHPKHMIRFKAITAECNAHLEIVDLTHVTPEECIERDRKRAHYVGEKVIRQMHAQFLFKREPKPDFQDDLPWAIMCDIDGTLALQNGRSPYEFEKAGEDLENRDVANLVTLYSERGNVILLTGREEKFRDVTGSWLDRKGIPWDKLFMRPTGDKRNDVIVKREIYEREIAGKFNVEYCLDDRDRIVALWRSLGLTCLQVDYGNF